MSEIILGPLLGYEAPGRYSVCLVVGSKVVHSDLTLEASAGHAGPPLVEYLPSGKKFIRFTLSDVLTVGSEPVKYSVLLAGSALRSSTMSSDSWKFHVPEADAEPRLVFASCNGFSSEVPSKDKLAAKFSNQKEWGMWDELGIDHGQEPVHMLIMGGDQVYTDFMLHNDRDTPLFTDWLDLSLKRRMKRSFTPRMEKQLLRFYEGVYMNQWGKLPIASAMASIPTVMMWDDHDIVDGWGSYEYIGESDVMQGLYGIAKSMFHLFQLRMRPENASILQQSRAYDSWSVRIGSHVVLGLDHRSERTISQVMSSAHWDDVDEWLKDELPMHVTSGVENFHIVSPVPVVYRRFGRAETAFNMTEWLRTEDEIRSLEDDVRDHWQHPEHQVERTKFIHTLLHAIDSNRLGDGSALRATILSGDVHVACTGRIKSDKGTTIQQIVSSGILHPAPKPRDWIGVLAVSSTIEEETDDGVATTKITRMVGQTSKFIRRRNYVSLKVRGNTPKLYVTWKFEGSDCPEGSITVTG